MYHSRSFPRMILATLGIVAVFGAATAQAADPVTKCRAAIAKSTAKYEQTRLKILQKCEAAIVKSDISGPCPDGTATAAIADAAVKLGEKIAKGCCGEDATCGTSDDVTTPQALGYGDVCANSATGASCSSVTIADLSDLAPCIACNAGGNVDGLIDVEFDSLAATMNGDLIKCQLEVGAKANKLFGAVSKENSKCRSRDLGGGSCPGTSDAYLGKSVGKIDKTRAKTVAAIQDKCTGFTAADIGLPASCPGVLSQGVVTTNLSESGTQCDNALDDDGDGSINDGCPQFSPAVVGVKETACGDSLDNDSDGTIDDGCVPLPETSCNDATDNDQDGKVNDGCAPKTPSCLNASIVTVNDYLDCVTCIAENSLVCPECNYCGNGVINFSKGETCDDGNVIDGDACPSDCRISSCTLGSEDDIALVDVSFTAPEGTSVAGMTLFLHYPEAAGVIEGSGNIGSGNGTSITNVAAGVSITPNDVDYGLRAVLLNDSLEAITPGRLFTVQLRLCQGVELSGKAFACAIVDAADPSLNTVEGVTCTAKLQ